MDAIYGAARTNTKITAASTAAGLGFVLSDSASWQRSTTGPRGRAAGRVHGVPEAHLALAAGADHRHPPRSLEAGRPDPGGDRRRVGKPPDHVGVAALI